MNLLKAKNLNDAGYWDRVWDGYTKPFSRGYSRRIIELIGSACTILNIGAGRDDLASVLGERVISTDISYGSLKHQQRHTTKVIQCDAVRLPFRDKSFNVVLASSI